MKKAFGLSIGLVAGMILGCFYLNSRFSDRTGSATAETDSTAPPHEVQETAATPARILALRPSPAAEITSLQNSVMSRVVNGDTNVFKLTPQQVEAFLARNRTNADSLLAAFNVTANPELLREAASRFPSNALVVASVLGHDVEPEKRREWIDQFKRLATDNPLPNYLSAREYLRNQQPQLGMQEFADASTKSAFTDYTLDRSQGLEELYLSTGYSSAEEKTLAAISVQEPALPALRDLSQQLSTLERQYASAGDTNSAAAIAKWGLSLAANISDAGTKSLGTQMLGLSAERDFLTGLDPNRTYDFVQEPIGERLTQIQAERKAALGESKWATEWLVTAYEPQLVSYFDRMKLYGEAGAVRWARTQAGDNAGP